LKRKEVIFLKLSILKYHIKKRKSNLKNPAIPGKLENIPI